MCMMLLMVVTCSIGKNHQFSNGSSLHDVMRRMIHTLSNGWKDTGTVSNESACR